MLLSIGFVAEPVMFTVATRPLTLADPVKPEASAFPTYLPRK